MVTRLARCLPRCLNTLCAKALRQRPTNAVPQTRALVPPSPPPPVRKVASHRDTLAPAHSLARRAVAMAVPGVLTEYIAKNYKRLLICVAPPATSSDSDDNELQAGAPQQAQQAHNSQHEVMTQDDEAPSQADASRRARRRSTLNRARRARRRRDAHGRCVYVQDGQQLVRGSFCDVCVRCVAVANVL